MAFLDDENRGPVTVVLLRAEDLHTECLALQAAIRHRKKGRIGEFYPLFMLNPASEGSAGSDLIYRAWKLGLQLQDETGWNLRVEFRRGKPEKELAVYSRELQAAWVYLVRSADESTASLIEAVKGVCKSEGLSLTVFADGHTDGETLIRAQEEATASDASPEKDTRKVAKKTGTPRAKAKKKAPAKSGPKKTAN